MAQFEAARVNNFCSFTSFPQRCTTGHTAYSIAPESRQGKRCASSRNSETRACVQRVWEENFKPRESLLEVFGSGHSEELHCGPKGGTKAGCIGKTSGNPA